MVLVAIIAASARFQFLIGTVKTQEYQMVSGSVDDTLFQFLIGTVKTETRQSKPSPFLKVSIPYRHGKNVIVAETMAEETAETAKFQFLIGTVKTIRK